MDDLLSNLPAALGKDLMERCERRTFPQEAELLREGQYVQAIPIVLKGLIKVFTRYEDRELLLYYIEPEESCIMSFWAGFSEAPSRVFARTEEDTELLLVPAGGLREWLREYPAFGSLFFQQYAKRYSELLDTIHHILFSQLDVRLYHHLVQKARLRKSGLISMSHQQLADELGTVREVVTRTLKKLESEGMVKQTGHRIELLKK